MKLRNLIITALTALTMTITSIITVSAHVAVFSDAAGIVDNYTKIDDALWDVQAEHNCNVLVHTTNSLEGRSIQDYADYYYETNYGENNDGILLVVSMDTSKYYIMTSGSCIYSFTDSGLNYIEAQIVPYMREGDYTEAFLTFAELCDDFMVQSAKGKPYDGNNMPKEPFNVGLSLLIALGVGLVAGLIGLFFLFSNLKSVQQQRGAADYRKPNSFHLDMQRDLYLYKKVERKEKPQNNAQTGSTTHTGDSGQTRGGSGGSF